MNHIKVLENMNEVPRYIVGICRPWKLDKHPGGNEFIQNFSDSIRDWREVHVNGFEYVNDKDDICYFLLMVKSHRDGRSIEVIYTHHTLSKSSIFNDSIRLALSYLSDLLFIRNIAIHKYL